ncbi:MAG TPA: S1/P1 nuclease [Opitutaceae bacterium]
MTSLPRTGVLFCILVALRLPALAWDAEGHAAIALVAEQNLSPGARAHVAAILGSGDMASVASWMDELRSAHFHAGPLGHDPDALKFDHEFPRNGEWHYVDMPLGTTQYTPEAQGARPDDVVHMAEAAVGVLEGRGDARITKREALCMLVHFVGDLHQPLHVGNGFFRVGVSDSAHLVEDPAQTAGLPNDKGGNTDFYGPGKYDELHAYWDTDLVRKVAGTRDPRGLALVLEKVVEENGGRWTTPGDYHHWPEAWATESLAAARIAYSGVAFGAESLGPKGDIRHISIGLSPDYDEVCVPVARRRLAQAGLHLAQILNQVHWQD